MPLYKKVKYSHTPFPQVILDEEKRSRIYYLSSQEWFIGGSKESNCMSARNIALLIAKKELGENFLYNSRYKTNQIFKFKIFNYTLINNLLRFPYMKNFYIITVQFVFQVFRFLGSFR